MARWMAIAGLMGLLGAAEDPPPSRPIRVAMIGDSTMASYPSPPADRPDLTGWGQVFGEFLGPEVETRNFAVSGRSSKSFRLEGRWEPVLDWGPDFVLIQFGHNDQPGKPHPSDPEVAFRENLRRYIREARAAGARPVLVTPVARRTFGEDGAPTSTLGPYAEAMCAVGAETGAPVIDLHAASVGLYGRLGDAASADFNPAASDRTHFSRKGAREMARLVAEAIPNAAPALRPTLKGPDR